MPVVRAHLVCAEPTRDSVSVARRRTALRPSARLRSSEWPRGSRGADAGQARITVRSASRSAWISLASRVGSAVHPRTAHVGGRVKKAGAGDWRSLWKATPGKVGALIRGVGPSTPFTGVPR